DDDKLLFWVAMAVVFMTAFYSFRAIFLTFHGEYRGGEDSEHTSASQAHATEPHEGEHHGTPHESPWVMAMPLLILAVPAIFAGFLNLPWGGGDHLGHLLEGALPLESEELLHHGDFSWPIAIGSTVLVIAGIALAYAIYEAKAISAESLQKTFGPLHELVSRKYYMDDLYEGLAVKRVLMDGIVATGQWFDTNI